MIELLIVILIVGILAAVGVPLYLSYTQDAKLAEAKALAGAVHTALQGCVQAKGGGSANCAISEIRSRVGLSTTDQTGDQRWEVASPTNMVLSGTAPALHFLGNIDVKGIKAGDNNTVALRLVADSNGTRMFCNTAGNDPPATDNDKKC